MKQIPSSNDSEEKRDLLTENEISKMLLNIFIKVHTKLGPGLLESVYEEVICYELAKTNLKYKRQRGIPLVYDEVKLDIGFRADIIVENKVIVEIKSVELMAPVFHKQVLTYLKLTNLKLGLLVNFNVPLLKDGYTRLVNNL
ncbi:MAG: GxxExxY protein [Bacteroidia bacterium]